MAGGLLLILVLWIVGILVVYAVIKAAIDNSKAAEALYEIRDLLREQAAKPAQVESTYEAGERDHD